jgi:hypothetical protein
MSAFDFADFSKREGIDPGTANSERCSRGRHQAGRREARLRLVRRLIIDSGNGIQCLWRSQDPIKLGDPINLTVRRRPVRISVLHVLAFTVDLVGLVLPLCFSPGSFTCDEGFMVTLTINKDGP